MKSNVVCSKYKQGERLEHSGEILSQIVCVCVGTRTRVCVFVWVYVCGDPWFIHCHFVFGPQD